MLAAALLTMLTVSSVGFAQVGPSIRFSLEPAESKEQVQVSFRTSEERSSGNWSTSLPTLELAGLDLNRFRAPGSAPIRFELLREAGRINCVGAGGNSVAAGQCSFSPDPAFAGLLAAQGYRRPSQGEYLQMALAGVNGDLIQALGKARYPRPSLSTLVAMAAVGVTSGYIDDLAQRGYRPSSTADLVQFRALDISPEFIDSFARAGYGNLDAAALVQFKALDIDPQFIAGFERIGYRNLKPERLVQLKALEVTPADVEGLRRDGVTALSTDQLVRLRVMESLPAPRRRR